MQATPDQLGAYFLWLKDRGLRYPVKAAPKLAVATETTDPVDSPAIVVEPTREAKTPVQVVFVGDEGFSAAERELLVKMISAMQLTGAHQIIDRIDSYAAFEAAHTPQLVIPLGAVAAAAFLEFGFDGDVMPTLHPRDLIRRPDDKRIAWTDLKRAMARLKA